LTSRNASPLSRINFAITIGIAAAILLGFNLFVARAARNSVPRQLVRQMDATHGITHLALGNSLIAAGFDAPAFDASMAPAPAVAFNAGLGSSAPVEHLMLLRRGLHDEPTAKFVVYGFFDFQLTDAPVATFTDLFGNRAVAFYLDRDLGRRDYQMRLRDKLEYDVFRHVPMLVDRSAVWWYVEQVRRTMGEIGMPVAATNRFGRVADFALLEARSRGEFESKCEKLTRDNVGLSAPIVQMIEQARARGAQAVFVEMPMHPYHQAHFYSTAAWQKYRDHLRRLIEAQHAVYLTASDWISAADEFQDHLHLSPQGAADFSRRLATRMRDLKALPPLDEGAASAAGR
jgi:hypothetical protein